MAYCICIIDDCIPTRQGPYIDVDDTKCIDANVLRSLLGAGIDWGDEQGVKKLVADLIKNQPTWKVCAFKDPNLLVNAMNESYFTSDFIVFDWDYPTITNQEEILVRILNDIFAIVLIYSGADKEKEIRQILGKETLKPFRNRVDYEDKSKLVEGADTYKKIIERAKQAEKDNFSFKFGRGIRQESLKAVEKILVGLGKVTLNDTRNYFKLTDGTSRDLIEIIGERFKSYLAGIKFNDLPDIYLTDSAQIDESLAKELWGYRLYFFPHRDDDIVRRGDLVYNPEKGKDQIYLVISGDCDLAKFWHKNFGYVNLVPLEKVCKERTGPVEKLKLTRGSSKIKESVNLSSLTNGIGVSSVPFVIPFLKVDNLCLDYIGFPLEILSIQVNKPSLTNGKNLKDQALKYSYWPSYKRIATVSEPFLSPLVEHITKSLSGFGVPDYPEKVQDMIKKTLKDALE